MKRLFLSLALWPSLVPILPAEQIVFSEVMYHPPVEGFEFVEVENLTATPFDIAQWELGGAVDFTFPDFNPATPLATFLKAFERIIFCETDPETFRAAYQVPESVRIFGPWTGQLNNAGERISLRDKNGVTRCTMAYDDRDPWPLAADGAGHSLILTDDSFAIDDYRVWSSAPPTPGFGPTLEAEEPFPSPEVNLATGIPFVNYGDSWAFNDQNLDLGSSWKEVAYAFTHDGWTLEGAAGNNGGLYGFENSSLPPPGLQTPLLNSSNEANHLTYYFRKEFTYNGPTGGSTVTIDSIVDDGVYFYLNGTPIGGVGSTPDPGWKARATRTVSNASEEFGVATNNGAALVEGTNIICAEVHQTNDSSSDCVFGARLSIAAPSSPSLVINEVLPANDGFLEFFNPGEASIDLAGWYLSDSPGNLTQYQIPAGLTIPPAGLASLAYGPTGLAVAANTVVYLTEPNGTTIANAIDAAIPLDGRSLGRKGDGSSSWFLFSQPTPNDRNASSSAEFAPRINEVAFDQDGQTLWIECFNPAPTARDLSGLFLASRSDFSDKVALTGSLSADGFLGFAQSFPADDGEVTLFLINEAGTILDAVAVPHASGRPFSAAYPDGSGRFFATTAGSLNQANDPDRETGIVISEIMVDPPTNHRDGEFIELHNKSAEAIDLSGWHFTEGISFTFPVGSTLAPGAYLVVAANENFTDYPGIVGQYSGQLANGGELVRLVDAFGNLVDEVHYHTGGNWPQLAGGLGSSLELQHPEMDNAEPSAWVASDEADKSSFQTFTLTERYEEITRRGSASDYKELHLQAVGDAHLALKNLSLTRGTGPNLLPGGGSTLATGGSASDGWLCQGTHHQSTVTNDEFHLVSNGHGDVKANRCEIDVTGIRDNDILTFTVEARWISGKPTLNVMTWDRSFGGTFHLPVPRDLGTPGATNSRQLPSPAPNVSGLRHSPAVPTSSDPVRVTAKVSGADAVHLRHRLDTRSGDGPWNRSPMFDDGLGGGDEVAGDGIYSLTLSDYQSDNTIVQFYVEATSGGGSSIQPRLAPEKPAMWVVDNSSHPGDLRLQRFVISARDQLASGSSGDSATFDYKFPRLSNNYFNATFISNERDIIYNCEMRKSGSPWTRSSGDNFSRMKWKPPGDRRFRGYTKRSVDNDAGGGRAYHNRIIRYWLYLLGHPANENEFVRVIVNGGSASLREDVEPNANDFLKRNWEDGHKGELYRIDDEWWFDDDWGRQNRNATWEYKGTDEPERYSSEWIKRSRESEHDYSSFIGWTRMVGPNSFTREEMERTADIDMMAANAVVRGWCDDWDTLTRNRGKNGYFLRRVTDGKWMLIQWDSDLTFGNSGAPFIGNLAGVRNFFDKPYVQQRVNHYLREMVDKYTANSPRLDAWFQCEEDASNSYPSNESTYNNWNNARLGTARSTMGSSLSTEFDVTSGNGSVLSTSADLISLEGDSGAAAFAIRVAGQTETSYRFTSPTRWEIDGIQLREGSNAIVVEALDQEGLVVGSETFTVTKTGNAAPVPVLDADPGSYSVRLNSPFVLDASASYDPEGTSLDFSWELVGPGRLSHPTPDSAGPSFDTPGHFLLNLTLTDGDGEETLVTREIVAYANSGWDPFNEGTLRDRWTTENLSLRDGSTPPASYSLDETPNRLALKIEGDLAKPLVLASPLHPVLWQDAPSGDWSYAIEETLTSVQQGDYQAGIIIEATEEGSPVRFTIGMEEGDFLRVREISQAGSTILASIPWSDKAAVVRCRKSNASLLFQYRHRPGIWRELHTATFAEGALVAEQVGLFAATDSPQPFRVEFDDSLFIDPGLSSPTLEFLRITEVMYHPLLGTGAEFIELHNTGGEPLELAGVSFDDTQPFNQFVFDATTLAPGAFAMVVADTDAFQSFYGDAPVILGEWAGGALSNGGETIELLDPTGNVIHHFAYDDRAPWPLAADGFGPSLEVIDHEGNYNDPFNWRASAFPGGSPGFSIATDEDEDGLSDIQEAAFGSDPTLPDTDGDGSSDGVEWTAGTDPRDPSSFLRILTITRTAEEPAVEVIWSSIPGKTYLLETAATLDGPWTPDQTVLADAPVTRLSSPAPERERFFRIRVVQP